MEEYLWNINAGIELAALNSKSSVSGISKDPRKGLGGGLLRPDDGTEISGMDILAVWSMHHNSNN